MASISEMAPLRFITCGSVDDGKSTLLGRLLYESHRVFDDELQTLEVESKHFGTQGDRMDLSLLVDGLLAEREQRITIDVAYRYFATERRTFVAADAPGHEQYTRNMATGASTAQLAIILVDARKGLVTQTRRHTRIVALMGVRHALLAVNKMDLVGWSKASFDRIASAYRELSAQCGLASVDAIPISALDGDNVIRRSDAMRWYEGPTLLDHLESVTIADPADGDGLRLPVQWINRPDSNFRGVCGRIAAGSVQPGDRVVVLPSGASSTVQRLVTFDGDRPTAAAGDSVTLVVEQTVDVSRGDVIASEHSRPAVADQFEARLLWMSFDRLLPGRPYLLKLHYKEATATITGIKYVEDIDTGAHLAASTLACNEIGVVTLSLSQPVVFEPYAVNRTLGGFILIDKLTFETVGAGMLSFALRRSSNIPWQQLAIGKQVRGAQKQQHPRCIWFTGPSGAGKSTIANALEQRLVAEGRHTYILDGDNVRHGLNRDLGFTDADRVENIRRVAEVARLMVDAGLVVLVAFISPFRAERELARSLFVDGEFIEVFVDTPLDLCELRDPKGLYAKARGGALPHFTGIDSEYEAPTSPEIHLLPGTQTVDACVDSVLDLMI